MHIAKRRKHYGLRLESDAPATSWMLTFSDLLTLLLTFFVLRISMSTLDASKIQEMLKGVQRVSESEGEGIPDLGVAASLSRELTSLLGAPTNVRGESAEVEFSSDIRLRADGEGALLYLGGSTFESGSDELTPSGRVAVRQLTRVLLDHDYLIDIAGHTDTVPIHNERFSSNWELSAARAIAVARELISLGCEPERLSVVGYADTKPLAPNDEESGRARNRRIEVYVSELSSMRQRSLE